MIADGPQGARREGNEISISEAQRAIGDTTKDFASIEDKSRDAPWKPPTPSHGSNKSAAEEDPWRSLSYILFTIQFFAVTLDLFVETADIAAWHYAINSIEFVLALYLAIYQVVRLLYLHKLGLVSSVCLLLLLLSASMQLFIVAITAYWFNIDNDRDTNHFEWALFCVSLAWGFVNPATYATLEKATEATYSADAGSKSKKKESKMSPGQVAVSVFTKHFSRVPLLFFLGALFASGNAILTTYQGAVINELTKAVTKLPPNTQSAKTEQEITQLGGILAGVWFAANLSRFLFDLTSATMFATLEVWLRGTIFERAIQSSNDADSNRNSGSDPASEFQARYASDVNGVVSLYSTLLRGVIVNILLIITNFAFLVIEDWKIAAVTLGFLAMGVTSGPTELAGDAASSVQKISTEGMSLLGDEVRCPSAEISVVTKKHEDEVLVPLKNSLWRQSFFANGVDTYIHFFASFLTVVVVITMVWEVYAGRLDSSQFLGIFFVFKQLQKPSMKISAVIKTAVKRSANLKRVNDVIFTQQEDNVVTVEEKGEGDQDNEV